MARRYFSCPSCSHKLRYGAAHCGSCYVPTPLWNRRLPLWVVLCLFSVGGVVLAIA